MDFLHYVRTLRRRWRMIVALLFAGLVLGLVAGVASPEKRTDPVYFASHLLKVERGNPNLPQLAVLATTGEILTRVNERLGDKGILVATQVRVNPIAQTGLLQVIAIGPDPVRVVQVANTFGEEIVRFDTESQKVAVDDKAIKALETRQAELPQVWGEALACMAAPATEADFQQCKARHDAAFEEYDRNKSELERLKTPPEKQPNLASVNTAEAIPISPTVASNLLSAAAPGAASKSAQPQTTPIAPTASSSPTVEKADPRRYAALGAIAGLIIGCALALIMDRLDPRLRTKLDAEEAFGWPVITEIPVFSKSQRQDDQVVSYTHPRSRPAEAFRALRTALIFSDKAQNSITNDAKPLPAGTDPDPIEHEPAKVVLVTSPGPSEGKTTTVANLAAVFAEAGYSVFVLNCDFRRPQMHRYLGSPDVYGEISETAIPGVSLVNHVFEEESKANPADVLAAQREYIRTARQNFDIVLLDTAPLLATNDAADVLLEADQIVLVGRAGRTTKEAADRAAELLDRRNAPIVGIVLTAATEGIGGRYYYYYGAKSYYLDDDHRHYTDDRSYTDDRKRRYTDNRKRHYTDNRKRHYTDDRERRDLETDSKKRKRGAGDNAASSSATQTASPGAGVRTVEAPAEPIVEATGAPTTQPLDELTVQRPSDDADGASTTDA